MRVCTRSQTRLTSAALRLSDETSSRSSAAARHQSWIDSRSVQAHAFGRSNGLPRYLHRHVPRVGARRARISEQRRRAGTGEPRLAAGRRSPISSDLLCVQYPGTTRIDPARAVKAFHRPAAGNDQPLPDDVRPPHILESTLDYLFHTLMPTKPLSETHPFIRDRTRSIRQDFTVQNVRGQSAIECNERIARFHVLALGTLREQTSFSESQELEQLRKGQSRCRPARSCLPRLPSVRRQSSSPSTSFTTMQGSPTHPSHVQMKRNSALTTS